MRTAKSLIVLLALGLTGLSSAAGTASQGNAEEAPQAEWQSASGTRKAGAIVRIAADPAIIHLDDDTITWLLGSSGIPQKAAQDALGLKAAENAGGWIRIEPLSQSVPQVGEPRTRSSSAPESQDSPQDREMMRQLEEIYGPAFVRQMMSVDPKAQEKNRVELGTDPGAEQTITFVLSVQLPEDIRPAAKELLDATVNHLRAVLLKAHRAHEDQTHQQLSNTQSWRDKAEDDYLTATGVRSPGQLRVREQLDTIVDLSMLSPQMAFGEALEALQNSVEPPLQIAALWRDLLDNADLKPSAPINIGPLPRVKLGTALDVLLKAVSNGGVKLAYRITDSVITIGTAETLASHTSAIARRMTEADIAAMNVERQALSRQIRGLELDLAGLKARHRVIGEQIAIIGNQAREKLAKDTVTPELQKLVQMSTDSLQHMERLLASGRANEAEMAKLREALARANIDLARRQEELSKSAGGGQIEQLNEELRRIEIDTAEKQAQLDVLRKQLEDLRREIVSATAFDPEAARLRIAREALDAAEQRIAELKKRLLNLHEPTVTVIDAN